MTEQHHQPFFSSSNSKSKNQTAAGSNLHTSINFNEFGWAFVVDGLGNEFLLDVSGHFKFFLHPRRKRFQKHRNVTAKAHKPFSNQLY